MPQRIDSAESGYSSITASAESREGRATEPPSQPVIRKAAEIINVMRIASRTKKGITVVVIEFLVLMRKYSKTQTDNKISGDSEHFYASESPKCVYYPIFREE